MLGQRIERVELRRPDLRVRFTAGFAKRLIGHRVTGVARRAKYLLVAMSSGETLLMHLGMSGSFAVEPPTQAPDRGAGDPHDHVVFHLSSGTTVTFNDPRRFGFMLLLTPDERHSHPALGALGPEPLSPAFDADALARACRGRRVSLKAALLDQRTVAGLGNIYAVEALHRAGLSPRRRASTVAFGDGRPRDTAVRLAAGIKRVLNEAIARQADGDTGGSRFRVYDREGARCPRRACAGTIIRRVDAGRSTFYCPSCQR